MKLLRAIREDLVEKRLWPVAAALVVALVAVPVVLGRGSAEPAPPLASSAPQPPVAGSAAQPVVLKETGSAAPKGRFRDPFRYADSGGTAQDVAAVQTVTPDPSPTGTVVDVAASPGSPPATGGTAPAPPSAGIEPVGPVGEAAERHAAGYRVDLSWGPTAAPSAERDAVRLSTLDVGDKPEVVFMGVRPDGESALFLVLSEATATGDGLCRPKAGPCDLFELQAGDTEFLDVPTEDGIRQYELHVDRVAQRSAPTAEEATRLLARVSNLGRVLVAGAAEGGRTFVERYVYAKRRGVLVFSVPRPEDRAATSATGDLEAVPAEPGQ